MNLAIIIVTYNSEHLIRACVDSLGSFRRNVIAVDNGSTDGTSSLLKALEIRVIQNSANPGFACGANIGAKASSSPFLCFLNPDCEASPDLFIRGCEMLAGHPRRCAVPARIRLEDNVIDGIQPGYTRLKLLCDLIETTCGQSKVTGLLRGNSRIHDDSWHWPLGTCLFIHRDFFMDINGFNERYFMYCEDVDLGKRILSAGGEIVPIEYELNHYMRESAKTVTVQKLKLLKEGRLLYSRHHYGLFFTLALKIIVSAMKMAQGPKGAWIKIRQ